MCKEKQFRSFLFENKLYDDIKNLFSAGIFLTMTKRAPLTVTIGTSLFGASSSLVVTTIQNRFRGEKFSLQRTLNAAAMSACESALLSPLYQLMRLRKMNEHIYIGAGTSATAYNFIECSKYSNYKSSTWTAMMGVIGGLSTPIMTLFCQMLSNEKIFRAFRIGLEIFIVMLIDCGIGIYGHDDHQFWGNFFSQITLILLSEFGVNLTRRTNVFNRAINLDLIRGNLCKDKIINTQKFEAQLMEIHSQINSLAPHVINENIHRVKIYNDLKQKLSELKSHKRIFKQNNSSVNGDKGQSFNLPAAANEMKRLEKLTKAMRPQLMGDNNMHFLIGPRSGQIAVDLAPRDIKSGYRSAQRVIFEEYYGKFIYTDHTLHHNYENCRKSSRNFIIDSSEVLLYNRIFVKNNYDQ